jgi:hypothetical protein
MVHRHQRLCDRANGAVTEGALLSRHLRTSTLAKASLEATSRSFDSVAIAVGVAAAVAIIMAITIGVSTAVGVCCRVAQTKADAWPEATETGEAAETETWSEATESKAWSEATSESAAEPAEASMPEDKAAAVEPIATEAATVEPTATEAAATSECLRRFGRSYDDGAYRNQGDAGHSDLPQRTF